MAGEIISLDYTAPAPGINPDTKEPYESETPQLPGYQLLHTTNGSGEDVYQVRRVVVRSSVKLAQRGIAEEVVTYPKKYRELEEAIAAAAVAFDRDGPGDSGDIREPGGAALAQAAAQVQAARAPKPAAAPVAPAIPQL